jgi:hypothetical protein
VINHDPSSTFMTDVYTRIKKGNTSMRDDLRESSVVDTNLGPCLAMGVVSWLVLYSLYSLFG